MKNTLYLLGIFVLLSAWTTTNNWEQKVSPEILQAAQAGEDVEFIVYFKEQAQISLPQTVRVKEEKGAYVYQELKQIAERSQAGLRQYLKQEGVEYRSLFIVNALKAKGSLQLIEAIARRSEVGNLQPNPTIITDLPREEMAENYRNAVEYGIAMINADDVWGLGFTGQNVVIGGQDTGYDWEHPAIKPTYRGWDGTNVDHNYSWHDAIHEWNPMNTDSINPCGYDALAPCDDNAHGTHTMGTMVGDDGAGNQIGVAPGAKWICCRNMERGAGTPFSYLECFEWFLAPTDLNGANADPAMAPHVINNSWSCPSSEGCNSSNWETMRVAVENLSTAGVMVVVSAGNSGSSCSTIADPPSMYDESYAVGATNSDDVIVGFSSRGPVVSDASGRMKPDISAPGRSVRSSVPGGGYASFSGTSMAGPHVAGAVALMISADPTLAGDISRIEMLINSTAEQKLTLDGCGGDAVDAVPNNTYGHGRIDVLEAVNEILLNTATADVFLQENIKVFPNPFDDQISIKLGDLQGETTFELYTITGQLLQQKQWEAARNTTVTLPVKDLQGGVYIYKVKNGEATIGGKLAK